MGESGGCSEPFEVEDGAAFYHNHRGGGGRGRRTQRVEMTLRCSPVQITEA